MRELIFSHDRSWALEDSLDTALHALQQPAGPYADVNEVTKNLVFSAWNVVPDAIASLCSYEAERRMLSGFSKTDKP